MTNQTYNLKELQITIDETVRTLGGYWLPLSGLARVLEELGELGELILNDDFSEEFKTELSDVFVIVTCVANQYCARLDVSDRQYIENLKQKALKDIYLTLASDCGEYSRILNSYEGNKKLKPKENPVTVEIQASKIARDLIAIAEKNDLNLVENVEATMQKVKKRDANRFDNLYDPTQSTSSDRFIQRYGDTEKIWGLRDTQKDILSQDIELNRDTINRFKKISKIEGISKLVMLLPKDREYKTDFENCKGDSLVLRLDESGEFVIISTF